MTRNRPMRLLVDCLSIAQGGGVQVAIAFLVNLQNEAEIEWRAVLPLSLHIALPSDLRGDHRLVFLKKRPPFDRLWQYRTLRRIENEFAADVVFTIFGPSYFRARAPQVVGFALPNLIYEPTQPLPKQTIIGRFANTLRVRAFRQADHLIVETEVARQRLCRTLEISPDKVSVIGNSVNPILLRLSKAPNQVAVPNQRIDILIPSSYYKHKNLEITPSVAAAMRQSDPGLKFTFRFTLDTTSEHWRKILDLAEQCGVADHFIALGVLPLEDLAEAYSNASAVFLPTLREVSTAVYPESFFFMRPLVTSNLDFAGELCQDAALFVPPTDPKAIAKQLVRLAHSPEMQYKLVQAGLKQLERAYPHSDEKFATQIEILRQVSGMPRVCEGSFVGSVMGTVRKYASHFAGIPFFERLLLQGSRYGETGWSSTLVAQDAISFHDQIAFAWDAKYASRGFRRRSNFIVQHILPNNLTAGEWLDAGCGSGYFSRILAARGADVRGVDGSESMIKSALSLAAGTQVAGSMQFEVLDTIERMPFGDAVFSGCICFSVLEYLDNPFKALDELARVLRPSGTLILSIPDTRSVVRRLQRSNLAQAFGPKSWRDYGKFSTFSMSPGDLKAELRQRGFFVETLASFDVFLPRVLHRFLGPSLNYVVATKT